MDPDPAAMKYAGTSLWGRVFAVLAASALLGCETAPADIDPLPLAGNCVCSDNGGKVSCPDTHCGLLISVDKGSCDGKVGQVEVLVGKSVEPAFWKAGDTKLGCQAIPVGSEAVVHARADTPWKWQSAALACNKDIAGQAISHVLECKTQ